VTFPYFNRRLHLYLGLSLLPWFFVYGSSSIPFAHTQYFEDHDKASGLPLWNTTFERPLDVTVPDGQEQLRAFGENLAKEYGMRGRVFTSRRNPNLVVVNISKFTHLTQLHYIIDQKKLVAQDRRFRWDQFLTGMHARGGFESASILQNSWSVVVDIVCIGMILWIASGIYMWWGIPSHRGWGWLAIVSGLATFVVFLWGL
jgi:hypothetical protein